jgi:hypothetical protein
MTQLALANQIRIDRSKVRHELKAGEITVMQAIEKPCCQTATLFSLLKAQRRCGERTAIDFLGRLGSRWNCPISATRRVCDLTERQRLALAAALGERPA